jgi:hypothetical protein
MANSEAYVYGTPSAEESNDLWKRSPEEPDTDLQGFLKAENSLQRHLAKYYAVYGLQSEGDLYLRGDFFGDRTVYLELYLPELLGLELITRLQAWLRRHEKGAWRIVIPTYVEEAAGAIMVYRDLVCLGRKWEKAPERAFQQLAKLMRAQDAHGTYHDGPIPKKGEARRGKGRDNRTL